MLIKYPCHFFLSWLFQKWWLVWYLFEQLTFAGNLSNFRKDEVKQDDEAADQRGRHKPSSVFLVFIKVLFIHHTMHVSLVFIKVLFIHHIMHRYISFSSSSIFCQDLSMSTPSISASSHSFCHHTVLRKGSSKYVHGLGTAKKTYGGVKERVSSNYLRLKWY